MNIGLVYLYKDYFTGKSLDFIDNEIEWIREKKSSEDEAVQAFLDSQEKRWHRLKAASHICHREHEKAESILKPDALRMGKVESADLGWI